MAYPTAQEQQSLGLKTILDAYTPALPDAAKDVQTPSGGESDWTWFGLGVPGGGHFGDYGSALFGILSNAAGAGGTILEWVDDDVNDADTLAVGRAIFNGMEDLLQEAADRMADTREKVSQDDVMAGIKEGDWGNALLFVRDQFPNAAAYLASSMVGFGIPLVISESERTLEERMKNQGKDTGAATPLDVGASMLSAVINVAGERIPFLKFKKGLVDSNVLMASLKAALIDLTWEAGGGGAEEILTKIGTDAELTTEGVALQAFFEALGGLGTTPVSVGGQLSQRRTAKQVKKVLEERKEEIIAKLELEKEGPGSPLSKRLSNARIDRKIKRVREAKNLAKLNANYPVIPESEEQAPEDEAAVETPPTETPVETPPTGGTPEVTVNLEPLTPEEKAAEANRVAAVEAAEAERADKNKVVVEAHRVDVPQRPPPRSQPLPPEEAPLPPEDTPLPPEVLPRGEEGPGRVVGEQPVEGEYDLPPGEIPDWRTAGAESPIFGRSEENREKAIREAAARRADRATSRDARAEDQRTKAAPHIDEDIGTLRGKERQRARRKGESATTEDIRLTEEARNRADEGATGEEPVIATIIPTTDGARLTKRDVRIEDAVERIKEKRRQEDRAAQVAVFIRGKGKVNLSEYEAAKEAAALEKFEQERLARVEEKRKLEKEEAADIDASRKEEESNRQAAEDRQERRDKEQAATDREEAIAQAEMDAIDLANELAEEDYTKTEMDTIAKGASTKIKDPIVRKVFYTAMVGHIADIQAAKAEDASAARATAKARGTERATQPKTEPDQQPEPGQAADDAAPDRAVDTVSAAADAAPEIEWKDTIYDSETSVGTDDEWILQPTINEGVIIHRNNRAAAPNHRGTKEEAKKIVNKIIEEERAAAAPDQAAVTPPAPKKAATAEKKPTKKDEADAKRAKKAADKQKAADKKAKDAAKREAKAAEPPSQRQKNRWGNWKDKDTTSTASVNGYPAIITKVAEGSYEATYKGEPIVDEKGVGAGQNTKWVTLDAAKKAIEAKHASPQQKKVIAKNRRKSERAATWPQDREGRWSKTLGTQIAVIEKVGEKFTVKYGPAAVQEQTYATLANAQKYLEDNYPRKKTKTQVGDEDVSGKKTKFKYQVDEPVPNAPNHTARVWNDPDKNAVKPAVVMIDGEEFTRHKTSVAARRSISRLDEAKIQAQILKIRAREAKAEGKSASASQRAQRAAATAAGKTARQEDTVAKRSEVKNPTTPHIVSRSGVWPGMFLPKAGDKSKETRATEQQAFANVTYDHHASRMIGQKGYDVSLQYKDRMPIVYFSLVERADALTVAETINKNPLLFNRFINEQIESGRVARGAADIESRDAYNKRERAAQKAIDDHNAKSKATKKTMTPADKKRLAALRKKLKDLQDEGRLEKIAIYPGTQLDPGGPTSAAEVTGQSFDTALDDWIAFLEEQGVPEAALLQKLMEISTRTESEGAIEERVFFDNEKKKIVEYDQSPEFIYHVTPTASIDLIKEEGISPSIERGAIEYAPGVNNFVHVSDNIEDARLFADFLNSGIGKAGFKWEAGEAGAVSIIKVTNDGAQLFVDPNIEESREGVSWLVRRESISPDDIVSTEKYNPIEEDISEETVQVATDKNGLAVFEGGLDKTAPIAGTHISSNIESLSDGFKARYFKDVPIGVSIARIKSEELSSPTSAEPGGTPGVVSVIVRGRGMDYTDPADRKIIDDLVEESRKKSQAAVARGVKHGEEGTMVSAIPALLERGVDWVNGWNSIGEDSEIHVINPSVIEIVGRGELSDERKKHILTSNVDRMAARGEITDEQVAEFDTLTQETFEILGKEGEITQAEIKKIQADFKKFGLKPPTAAQIRSGEVNLTPVKTEVTEEAEEDISEDEANLRKSMEEAVEYRQAITDDINESYTTLLGEKRQDITDSLAHTPDSGGLSLPDIIKLAKTISSQEEGSFDFDPNDSRENYIEKILAWVDSKEDAITDVLEESEYMFDDSGSDILQSRMKNPTKGFDTPGQASNALLLSMHNIWGKKATGRMIDTGFIQILTFDQAVKLSSRYKGEIDSETNAFVDESDGSIIFISDNIANNTNDVRGLIMHEIGVHYGKRIFSGREFDQILDQVYKLSQDGDAAVEEAVDAVIKNYTNKFGFKKLGPPAIKKGDAYTRNETNSAFWEEVLAHLIQHKSAEISPTLWNRITRAFNTFFKKILRPFDPSASAEVDVNDIINIVEYAVGRVPSASLKKYDSNVLTRLASKTRKEFLKDSLVKDKVYHASPFEWTVPILEKGDLGFHAGTKAASDDARVSLKNVLDVEEASIIYEGYINIRNPLIVGGDLGSWANARAWSSNINSLGLDEDVRDYLLSVVNKYLSPSKSGIKWKNADIYPAVGDYMSSDNREFSNEMRGALIKLGYDSIEYTNKFEDKGSTSYILLKDGMFKSSKSMAFKGDQPSIYESRGKRIIKEVVDNTSLANKGRGLLNKTLKGIQRQIEPLMAIEGYKTLESARMLMKGEKTRTANAARILHDVIDGAKNKKEKDAITKYMETPNASPDNLPTRMVKYAPQPTVAFGTQAKGTGVKKMSIKEAVIKAKRDIESLGEDLVKAGALDKEQFEALRGQYLPRTYLKYLQSNKDRMGMAFLAGSMGYTKKRNKEESLMEDLLSGRIKDPAFLTSRYIAMAGGDLATINYLNFIASDPGNHGWVIPNQVIQVEGLSGTVLYFQDMSGGMRKRATILRKHDQVSDANKMEAFADKIDKAVDSHPEFKVPEGATYRKVPNTVQFGSMRGLMVHKDIWNDLTSEGVLTTDNQVLNNILRYSSKIQKTFKYTHVPMQIPAQSRNAISNFVLLNSSGTPIWRIPSVISKAVGDILHNGKYAQLARKYGIETTTFSSEELGKIDRELAMIKKDVGGWEGTWAKMQIMMDNWDIPGRSYQKMEVMFKVAKMIDLIENEGYSESNAAREANEAMLDYGNVSPLLRTLRSMPLGSPFITFNAKALVQMGRNIKNHPIAAGKYLAIPFIMTQALLAQFDDDDLDEEGVDGLKAFVASYAEDNHNVFFLPYRDDNGKWVAFDMSYFLPWGAHYSLMKNLAKGEIGEAVRDIGVLGGPYEGLIGLKFNHDPWTKQEIWNESDPPMQQAQDIMMFMASYMTPPMMMPRNKAGDIAAGGGPLWKTMAWAGWVEGGIGKDGLEKYDGLDAILPWFGINLMKIGEYEMRNKAYWKQKTLQDIIKRAEKIISDPNHTPERRRELLEEFRIFAAQKNLELQNWAEQASQAPM